MKNTRKTFPLFDFSRSIQISETDSATKTYKLHCNGAVGDMVYLTDLDIYSNFGHHIYEVRIYSGGKDEIDFFTHTQIMKFTDKMRDATATSSLTFGKISTRGENNKANFISLTIFATMTKMTTNAEIPKMGRML